MTPARATLVECQIPPEQLGDLLSGIGDVVDAAGGSFTIGYAALVITATRHNLR